MNGRQDNASQDGQQKPVVAKTRINLAAETIMLMKRLREVEIEETIASAELSTLIGMDVRSGQPGYRYLYAARQNLEPEGYRFAALLRGFDTDPSTFVHGLRRLNSEEMTDASVSRLKSIRRSARHETQRLAYVPNFDQMTPEKRNQWVTSMSLWKFVEMATRTGNIKKIEQRIGNSNAILPFGEVSEAMIRLEKEQAEKAKHKWRP